MGFENLTPPDFSLSREGLTPNERWKSQGMFAVPDMEVLTALVTKPDLGIFMSIINSAFQKVPTDELYANRKMEALLRLKSHVETALKERSQDDKATL